MGHLLLLPPRPPAAFSSSSFFPTFAIFRRRVAVEEGGNNVLEPPPPDPAASKSSLHASQSAGSRVHLPNFLCLHQLHCVWRHALLCVRFLPRAAASSSASCWTATGAVGTAGGQESSAPAITHLERQLVVVWWRKSGVNRGARLARRKEKKPKHSNCQRSRSKWRKFTSGSVLESHRRDEYADLTL